MRVLSVDIGVHNTAFYLEEFDENDIKNVITKHNISKSEKRYDQNGCTTGTYKKIVDELCKIGDCIFVERINLSNIFFILHYCVHVIHVHLKCMQSDL